MSALNVQQNSHFDAIYTLLPVNLKAGIDDLLARATRESAVKHTLDQLVRFSLGRDSTDEDPNLRDEWNAQKDKADKALSDLQREGRGKKRSRDEDDSGPAENPINTKRSKTDIGAPPKIDEDPVFTLHSVSVSSPVRKKVDITIYRKDTLRFVHSRSGAQEAFISLSTLTRAFLIPTPGKTKPHWTIIILSESNQTQVIFGLDAVLPSLTVTIHPEPPRDYPKGTESKFILTQFLSNLPSHIKFQEPSTKQFRSSTGDPYLDAYLRAKDGHLFFFDDGLLFGEKKPCMWIGTDQIENVRSLSATGRTFSLFVTRVADVSPEEEDPMEGEETEFSLIDGKNQDAVAQWVQNNRPRFGPRNDTDASMRRAASEQDELGEDEEKQEGKELDGDSEDDSDFESDSETDEGSATSQSSNDDNWDQAEPEEEARSSDEDGEGEDEGELSPSRHPLLRPGAMPKMSNAAINAVIGMVEEDMMNTIKGNARDGGDEDELDELEE